MGLKEILPALIPTQPHPLNLGCLERIHGDTPHKTDVNTQSSMNACAGQTDEYAEFGGCPLW